MSVSDTPCNEAEQKSATNVAPAGVKAITQKGRTMSLRYDTLRLYPYRGNFVSHAESSCIDVAAIEAAKSDKFISTSVRQYQPSLGQ